MTPHQASKLVLSLAIVIFCALFFFNLGRLTNSTVHLRSACDLPEDDRGDLKASWYSSAVGK